MKIVDEYYDENSVVYSISIQFKMQIKSLIDEPKKLLELIDACLKPKESEKKKFGEVFTPMKLVNEMLDKLPQKVWTNEKLKWVDPAAGMGNFPIAVYLRLMENLKDKIPNESKRKRHILENMLYMSELNKKNCYIIEQIFNIGKKYKLNLHCGDTLELNIKKKWDIEKFDIIMGNPPYQDGSGNRGKGHTLWTQFVLKSFSEFLKVNGYLVFIHPSLWRQVGHELLDVMKQKQIIYLSIHDEKDGQKTFKCSTRYDWYVIKNSEQTKETIIRGQDGKIYKINLSEWQFIPNCMFHEISEIIAHDEDDKIDVIESRSAYGHDKKWVSKNENDIYKYPVVYSVNRKNELTLHYSSVNSNGHFGISKLIFGSGATGFVSDKEGLYGLTQWAVGISDKPSNLDKIKKALESEKFGEVIKATSVSKAEINRKILKCFKKNFYVCFL